MLECVMCSSVGERVRMSVPTGGGGFNTELSQRPAGGRTAMGENGPAGGPRTSQGRHQGYFRFN